MTKEMVVFSSYTGHNKSSNMMQDASNEHIKNASISKLANDEDQKSFLGVTDVKLKLVNDAFDSQLIKGATDQCVFYFLPSWIF